MTENAQQKAQRLQRLKARARELLEQGVREDIPSVDDAAHTETEHLVEDLRTYQVELELQNEELRLAQLQADLARQRYQSLFGQMPVPALVLDEQGLIEEMNDSAVELLSPMKRNRGGDRRLLDALTAQDRARLYAALRDVTQGGGGEPVLSQLQFDPAQGQALVLDAHLMELPLAYHLDHRVLILLVDRTAEIQRQKDQQFFSMMLDSTDNFIYAADRTGRFLVANRALLAFLSRSREEVVGQRREHFLPLRDAIMHAEADQRVLQSGQAITLEEQVHIGGPVGRLEYLTRKFPLYDESGQIYGVGGVSTDITEIKSHQMDSLLSEVVFRAAAESIIVTDAQTNILRVNPAFTRQSGFSTEAVCGHRASVLKSGRQTREFYEAMWKALSEADEWTGELTNRRSDGAYYTVWCNIKAVRNASGVLINYCAVQTDLTPLRAIESEVRHMASYDSLTGLPNRTLFNDRIAQLIAFTRRRNTQFALLFIDIDHFKVVNDTMGHPAGDELLRGLAQRLQEGVRAEDTVARMGGDEFVVLLPASDRAQAQVVAHNLLEQLHEPMTLGGTVHYQPMASVGIAIFPEDGETADLLLRNADMAMYEAKLGGRNRAATFTPSMAAQSTQTFSIQNDLAGAVRRNELRVHYQPKYSLLSGALVGAEALVRWERPGHGLLLPGAFVPVAERSGLLVQIDDWVLRQALDQMVLWRASGYWDDSMRMAVNQNAGDLRQSGLLEHLKGMLAAHQLAASCLELEITEDVLLEHTEELVQRLQDLRSIGVALAIDDFGTGYSSLTYIQRLPVSVIKIDRSFIRDMMLREGDRILVETVVGMARKLGLEMVAEGVEEQSQLMRLAELGCDIAQGYLLGHPVPPEDFVRLYAKHADLSLFGTQIQAEGPISVPQPL